MTTSSDAYIIDCATYGDPPTPPLPEPVDGALNTVTTVATASYDDPSEVPEAIPGLWIVGSTYNVLNGKYADPKSTMQQVIDYSKSEGRPQEFGGKRYRVPKVVNFTRNTTSDYHSASGKTTSEYTKSLSVHAGFDASFPGFSASASADYSESQRENLAHSFTRVSFNVTHYNLSLPPVDQLPSLFKPWFVHALDTKDPIELYREYGTHLLRSLTIGGRGLFLCSTDTRSYDSEISVEVAAKLSARYLVSSGSVEFSAAEKEAMKRFNSSSETSVATKGGDPRYGNEEFLKNVEAWKASIVDYPEFVDFGSLPCFIGIWEFASTQERRDTLKTAFAQFVKLYTQDLSLPGPYLHARSNNSLLDTNRAQISVGSTGKAGYMTVHSPPARRDGYYLISPATGTKSSCGNYTIAKELVPGALAPVGWEEDFVTPFYHTAGEEPYFTRVWRAVPPSPDYIALGFVAMTGKTAKDIPSQPPAVLAGHFRAVHKSALTGAAQGVTYTWLAAQRPLVHAIDYRYQLGGHEIPEKSDCFVLDSKKVIKDWKGW